MHVVLFESALTGHHSNYLYHIATLFLGLGHRVSVTLQKDHRDNPVIVDLLDKYPDRFKIFELALGSSCCKVAGRIWVIGSELRYWLLFREVFNRITDVEKIDFAFFPYLDYCLHAIALFGSPLRSVSWFGVCMRPSFHYRSLGVLAPKTKWGWIKQRLFYRALRKRSLKKIFTIDELLEKYIHQKGVDIANKLSYIPDPAELNDLYNQDTARDLLGLPRDDFIILVYGAINSRKGIEQLVQGLHCQKLSRRVRVLVVGIHTPELCDQLANEPCVTSINGYADRKTEEAAFRAADAVWVGYRNHYVMSGVLILAAMAGKPVLATRNGLIGWMTRRYALGLVIDCEKRLEVTEAISKLLQLPPSSLPGGGMEDIRMRHTWREFDRIILKVLRCDNS
jgi:glycosyltransferase involved in cell wall biosynthesis